MVILTKGAIKKWKNKAHLRMTTCSMRAAVHHMRMQMMVNGSNSKEMTQQNWIDCLNIYMCCHKDAEKIIGSGIEAYYMEKVHKVMGGTQYVFVGKRKDGLEVHIYIDGKHPEIVTMRDGVPHVVREAKELWKATRGQMSTILSMKKSQNGLNRRKTTIRALSPIQRKAMKRLTRSKSCILATA